MPQLANTPSALVGTYPCPRGCGRVLTMPGSVARHLLTCATTIDELKVIGGCSDTSDDECWLWKKLEEGQRRRISFRSPVTGTTRRRYVYVIAFILVTGFDPEENGTFVCHTCDDGRCFNPNHLFNGTNADNLQDMSRKGRAGGFRKIDPERRREIARMGGIAGTNSRWNKTRKVI